MGAVVDGMAIAVTGFMVGNELAIAVFVHPALWRLQDKAHAAAAGTIARVLGRVMPFWYALGWILITAAAIIQRWQTGRWPVLMAIAAVLWALIIAVTVIVLVPINNRVSSWTEATRPADWKVDRQRWDSLHRWRVVLLAVSFFLLLGGVLGHV